MLSRAFILLIGDDSAVLLPPQGNGKAAPVWAASHGGEDAAPLLKILESSHRVPVFILADTLAQTCRRETLPPVGFLDKRKLLARRMERGGGKTILKTARLERNGLALFAEAECEGPIGLWLSRLAPMKNPSGEVCLLPLESATMVEKLAPAARDGWGLLLSCHKTGGFRQIVTKKGEMVFTRLTPPLPPEAHADFIAQTLAQDIHATRAYLARTGLGEETPLHLAAILPSSLHQAFAGQSLPVAGRLLFSPREAAARLDLALPPGPEKPEADIVHALWLQKKAAPFLALIRPEQKKERRLARLRKAGTGLAGLLFLLALVQLGISGLNLWRLAQENALSEKETAALEASFEQARATLAQEAESLALLRKAVERRRLFAAKRKGPEELVALAAKAMSPSAKAVSLVWQNDELKLDLLLRAEDIRPRLDDLTRQRITRDFDNVALMMRGAMPGYDVRIVRYPFPNLPGETITNKANGASTAPVATFSIRKESP